jgi:prepilin-type N-terminal cleavage/methylation domain-containing protein
VPSASSRRVEKVPPVASCSSGLRSAVSSLGPAFPSQRHGLTLIEILIVLTIAGTVMALAFPRMQQSFDRIAVRGAASDLSATLHSARSLALSGRIPVAVDVDGAKGTVRVRRGNENIFSRNIGFAHGVELVQTRDSLTFGPLGLGRGAANLSIVVRRRAAVETVFVSRLGRIR